MKNLQIDSIEFPREGLKGKFNQLSQQEGVKQVDRPKHGLL